MLQTVLKLTRGPAFAELRNAFFLWVRQADTQQLQAWSLNVLDAETLDQVFKL